MANLFMRFPMGKKKALTLSYDDGVEQDIRLTKLLDSRGIRCTFNINSGLLAEEGRVYPKGEVHRVMTTDQCSRLLCGSCHEVAIHGFTHPFLNLLPGNLMTYEILKDRENLEQLFGTIVRGCAYPFGTYSEEVIACLKSCGIVYARTVRSTHDFQIPLNWLELPATCHHNDPALPELTEEFIKGEPSREPWLFYLWGHSYEFEINDNWDVMERFVETAGAREDVWYAANIEVYDYIQNYNRLQFSVDGKIIYNPTGCTLYFAFGGQEYEIKPLSHIRL